MKLKKIVAILLSLTLVFSLYSCSTVVSFAATITGTLYEAIKNGGTPVWNDSNSNSTQVRKLSKGTLVTIVSIIKNKAGNLWGKTSNETWIYMGNLKKSSKSLPSVGDYVTNKSDVPLRYIPASGGEIQQYLEKGAVVKVSATFYNDVGNPWGNTSDGYAIYMENLAPYVAKIEQDNSSDAFRKQVNDIVYARFDNDILNRTSDGTFSSMNACVESTYYQITGSEGAFRQITRLSNDTTVGWIHRDDLALVTNEINGVRFIYDLVGDGVIVNLTTPTVRHAVLDKNAALALGAYLAEAYNSKYKTAIKTSIKELSYEIVGHAILGEELCGTERSCKWYDLSCQINNTMISKFCSEAEYANCGVMKLDWDAEHMISLADLLFNSNDVVAEINKRYSN